MNSIQEQIKRDLNVVPMEKISMPVRLADTALDYLICLAENWQWKRHGTDSEKRDIKELDRTIISMVGSTRR